MSNLRAPVHCSLGHDRRRVLQRPVTVLLVEDDPAMRLLLEEVLRQADFIVRNAGDGDTAVAMLTDRSFFPHPPDAVVSDIRMPGYSGLEIVALMHEAGIHIPTFLMTAFGDEETHRKAAELGVCRVFDKPFDPFELRRALLDVRCRR